MQLLIENQVVSLEFEATYCGNIDEQAWAQVLPAMSNLRRLGVSHQIPLDWAVLPQITFRLTSFTADCSLIGAWLEFLQKQPEIEELFLLGDFFAVAPTREQLPKLEHVTARCDDVAKFAGCHPLISVHFFTGASVRGRGFKTRDITRMRGSTARFQTARLQGLHMRTLLREAPQTLTTLQHLVLDEDTSWRSGRALEVSTAVLNRRLGLT